MNKYRFFCCGYFIPYISAVDIMCRCLLSNKKKTGYLLEIRTRRHPGYFFIVFRVECAEFTKDGVQVGILSLLEVGHRESIRIDPRSYDLKWSQSSCCLARRIQPLKLNKSVFRVVHKKHNIKLRQTNLQFFFLIPSDWTN